jgi:hypothetical protein
MGKNSRAKGKAFEKRVEQDLEKLGWTVIKFNKKVDLEKNMLVTAKAQFNPFFGRIVGEGSGFPDFICFKKVETEKVPGLIRGDTYHIKLVESKTNNSLDKKEKEMVNWIKTNLGLRVIIASPGLKRGQIVYVEQ